MDACAVYDNVNVFFFSQQKENTQNGIKTTRQASPFKTSKKALLFQ